MTIYGIFLLLGGLIITAIAFLHLYFKTKETLHMRQLYEVAKKRYIMKVRQDQKKQRNKK